MQPLPASPHNADPRLERLRLLGFAGLVALAAVGLGAAGGPPRLPTGLPRLEQVLAVLSGSTLPVEALVLVLVDAAWLMWLWIVGSLALELLVGAAEAFGHGAGWVRSLRRLADRVTVPLVRRAVAAAFAVQVLSRGVPLAAAAPLPPTEVALVASINAQMAGWPSTIPTIHAPASAATYVVRDGDTLWSIADQAYGSGTAYRRLVEANIGRRMPDGQIFTARGVIRPGWELVVPMPAWHIDEVDGQRWYTVEASDTLSAIAASVLGDDSRWRELFDLNRDASSPDGEHALTDPNVIWPGLRLRLPESVAAPDATAQTEVPAEAAVAELVAASTTLTQAPPAAAAPDDAVADAAPGAFDQQPPLVRTPHDFDPIALEPSDSVAVVPDDSSSPAQANSTLPTTPPPGELPTVPLALGGMGLAALAGVALGARHLRRLRPLPHEPESEVVVEGGFAEAQLTHEFTRGLHGVAFDPLAAIVGQLQQFLDEYNLGSVNVLTARHGRTATTLTLAAGLSEQPLLVDLAPVFAARLEAEAEAWVSADQDVVLRVVRLRRTKLLPAADAPAIETPWLMPLGVLYDRQTYWAVWRSLGNVLVASLPGHGADTILTSLVATLTARRSPEQLRMWLVAQPRALPAPLFDVPHLVQSVDPGDDVAVAQLVDQLRDEIDARSEQRPQADLVVVVPELTSLGEQAASLALLAAHGVTDNAGVRIIAATSCPEASLLSPLLSHFDSRMVLRMQDEETSVALLGVADAAFMGGGGRLLARLDGREPVELYGYQVTPAHLERLVRVMRSAYPTPRDEPREPPAPTTPSPGTPPSLSLEPYQAEADAPDELAIPVPGAVKSEDGLAAITSVGPPIEVICFGGPRVVCAGQQVWPRRAGGDAKPWELLLYLACQPAAGVSSDEAVEALWPEDEESDNAPHRFRQLRYRLRRMLSSVPGAPETDGICLDRGTLLLDPGLVHSDAQEFLGLVRSARLYPGPNAVSLLERARALFIGDLLEGPDARRYAWVDERDDSGVTLREHFRRLFQQASTKLAELYDMAGEFGNSIDLYRELTEIDPGDERLWCALFRLHAQRGDRPALVREEHRMRQTFRDLSTDPEDSSSPQIEEPSRETVQEYQRLLASLRDPEREPAAV
jgi:DNA-binding SARP family transcriptional activator/LysM repeat protein